MQRSGGGVRHKTLDLTSLGTSRDRPPLRSPQPPHHTAGPHLLLNVGRLGVRIQGAVLGAHGGKEGGVARGGGQAQEDLLRPEVGLVAALERRAQLHLWPSGGRR